MAGSRKGRRDLALVYARTEDGDGFHILRRRAATRKVEAGTLRKLDEGRAIVGEVVKLSPRDESPLLFDVERDEELSTVPPPSRGRPARVATEKYRRGWDVIWGRRGRAGEAVN